MTDSNDIIEKPEHYTYGKYECWDVLEDILKDCRGPEAFYIGNVIKYLWRYRHKNGLQDLLKAQRYLEKAIAENKKGQPS